jgi:hypothetical protein
MAIIIQSRMQSQRIITKKPPNFIARFQNIVVMILRELLKYKKYQKNCLKILGAISAG